MVKKREHILWDATKEELIEAVEALCGTPFNSALEKVVFDRFQTLRLMRLIQKYKNNPTNKNKDRYENEYERLKTLKIV